MRLGASVLLRRGLPEAPALRASVRCGLKARSSLGMPRDAILSSMCGGEGGELRAGLQADPEDARGFCGGEESVSAELDFGGGGLDGG